MLKGLDPLLTPDLVRGHSRAITSPWSSVEPHAACVEERR